MRYIVMLIICGILSGCNSLPKPTLDGEIDRTNDKKIVLNHIVERIVYHAE